MKDRKISLKIKIDILFGSVFTKIITVILYNLIIISASKINIEDTSRLSTPLLSLVLINYINCRKAVRLLKYGTIVNGRFIKKEDRPSEGTHGDLYYLVIYHFNFVDTNGKKYAFTC